MATIGVETVGNQIRVVAPYTPTFPRKAKALGGRWNPSVKAWDFDIRHEDRVHELLTEEYGWTAHSTGRTVTVQVTLDSDNAGVSTVRLAGRQIARRPNRDSAVILSAETVIVAGEFDRSGGSAANPAVISRPSTEVTLEVRDFPIEALAAETALEFTIIDKPDVDVQELKAERAKLVARLAEIDALLN